MKNKCRAGDKLPTEEAMNKIIDISNPKYQYLFDIARLTGFRISELLNLRAVPGQGNYIDFEKRKIILAKQKNGRINEPFMLFPELDETLKEYINRFFEEIWAADSYLFFTKRGGFYKKMSRSTTLSMVQHYRKKAGLTEIYGYTKNGRRKHRFSMHSTRHYAINHWGKKCVEKLGVYDTNTVSCLSRHKNPNSLDSYKVLNEEIRRKVTDTLLT